MTRFPAAPHGLRARLWLSWKRQDKGAAGRRKSLRQPVGEKKRKKLKKKKKKSQRGVTLCQTEGGRVCRQGLTCTARGVYCCHWKGKSSLESSAQLSLQNKRELCKTWECFYKGEALVCLFSQFDKQLMPDFAVFFFFFNIAALGLLSVTTWGFYLTAVYQAGQEQCIKERKCKLLCALVVKDTC